MASSLAGGNCLRIPPMTLGFITSSTRRISSLAKGGEGGCGGLTVRWIAQQLRPATRKSAVSWIAVFMVVNGLRQRQKEPKPGEPLRACMEGSLAQVEHHIRLLRSISWWHILPPSHSGLHQPRWRHRFSDERRSRLRDAHAAFKPPGPRQFSRGHRGVAVAKRQVIVFADDDQNSPANPGIKPWS